MKLKNHEQLKEASFKVIEWPASGKLSPVLKFGYMFSYKGKRWFLQFREFNRHWAVIDPYTGHIAYEDRCQGGAILKLIKGFYDRQTTQTIEDYHGTCLEIMKARIKLPVNKR